MAMTGPSNGRIERALAPGADASDDRQGEDHPERHDPRPDEPGAGGHPLGDPPDGLRRAEDGGQSTEAGGDDHGHPVRVVQHVPDRLIAVQGVLLRPVQVRMLPREDDRAGAVVPTELLAGIGGLGAVPDEQQRTVVGGQQERLLEPRRVVDGPRQDHRPAGREHHREVPDPAAHRQGSRQQEHRGHDQDEQRELLGPGEGEEPADHPEEHAASRRRAVAQVRDHEQEAAEEQQREGLGEHVALEQPEAGIQRGDQGRDQTDPGVEVPLADQAGQCDDHEADCHGARAGGPERCGRPTTTPRPGR